MGPFLKDEPDIEMSGLFLHLNTNKKGITLNLKTATGRKILKELASDTDILVESFSPRVMPGLGLDYQTLEAINPNLLMVSISSFGQTGRKRRSVPGGNGSRSVHHGGIVRRTIRWNRPARRHLRHGDPGGQRR